MRYSFLLIAIILLFTGCNKDKFTTKPQLKYKSVNSTTINRGSDLVFDLSFTDAEGDISDSLFIQHVSLTPGCTNTFDSSIGYPVPKITSGEIKKGDIAISFSYAYSGSYPQLSPSTCGGTDNDTCYFRFMLKDQAGNKSDTINSETIVLLQ